MRRVFFILIGFSAFVGSVFAAQEGGNVNEISSHQVDGVCRQVVRPLVEAQNIVNGEEENRMDNHIVIRVEDLLCIARFVIDMQRLLD